MTLATLTEAITWTRDHWAGQRTAPLSINTRQPEGNGLFFTPRFASLLQQPINAAADMDTSRPCNHWQRRAGELCGDCAIYDQHGKAIAESGIYEKRERFFLYPMSVALDQLRKARNDTPRHPHPYILVLVLADHGWDAHRAANAIDREWSTAEALFLRAIRQLEGRYHEGPRNDGVAWIDKSASQQAAEAAA